LFQYVNGNGEHCGISSSDVNNYLREITGQDFTAKDFRTWAGTVAAALALSEGGSMGSQTEIKKSVVAAIKRVAERLGNRPATCRNYYVHPAVIEAYSNGGVLRIAAVGGNGGESSFELNAQERAVVRLIERQL
jgi:DNA topoisomerase-1